MRFLLDVVYLSLLVVFSPALVYSAIWQGKYREGYLAKFLGRVPRRGGDRPCIWFHAVSVGEVNLLATLIERWEKSFPDWEYVISTTTKSGWDLARQKYAGRTVFYCPLDFSWAVREAISRVRPDVLVLAELELWPNLIRCAKQRGCRIAIVNGRLSERSFSRYWRIRSWIGSVLRNIDVIIAQNDEYADRFRQLGALSDAVQVSGSVKFDGARGDRENSRTRRFREAAGIAATDVVFLAGSTQAPEESLAVNAYCRLHPDHPRLRLLIAPRHIHRCDEIARMLDASGCPWQRRTDLESHGADPSARILLIDTIGELGAWWGTARIAFVGGSMGSRGGQNMIEPAAYGAAVSFGPNTRNFRDIVGMLLRHDAGVVVHDGHELTQFVKRCLDEPAWSDELGRRARELVQSQQGAADLTIKLLARVANNESAKPNRSAA